jgi:hypothetical protein
MKTRLSLLLLAVACGVGALASIGGSSASAAPVLSTRITNLSAVSGGTTVHVEIKAKCASGWDNDFFYNLVDVRQDTASGGVTVAHVNVHGSTVGWNCDGQNYDLVFDIPMDVAGTSWEPGTLRASFDSFATQDGGATWVSDYAKKSLRLR